MNESAGIDSKGGMGGLGQGGGAGAMNSQFKQRDKNNDGKLGRDELPAALFDKLDADKDGFVSEEELQALWRQNGTSIHEFRTQRRHPPHARSG